MIAAPPMASQAIDLKALPWEGHLAMVMLGEKPLGSSDTVI
jgi:hypothetical protein